MATITPVKPVTHVAKVEAEKVYALRSIDPNFKTLSGEELSKAAISRYDEVMKLLGLEDEED